MGQVQWKKLMCDCVITRWVTVHARVTGWRAGAAAGSLSFSTAWPSGQSWPEAGIYCVLRTSFNLGAKSQNPLWIKLSEVSKLGFLMTLNSVDNGKCNKFGYSKNSIMPWVWEKNARIRNSDSLNKIKEKAVWSLENSAGTFLQMWVLKYLSFPGFLSSACGWHARGVREWANSSILGMCNHQLTCFFSIWVEGVCPSAAGRERTLPQHCLGLVKLLGARASLLPVGSSTKASAFGYLLVHFGGVDNANGFKVRERALCTCRKMGCQSRKVHIFL